MQQQPPNGQIQQNLQFYNPANVSIAPPPNQNNMRQPPNHHQVVYPFVPTPQVRQRHPHQYRLVLVIIKQKKRDLIL